METKNFINKQNQIIYYESWEITNPICNVVISHGMAEHPKRYDDFALYLNKKQINVFAIYHIGHGPYTKILGHMDIGDFNKCVDNLNELISIINLNNLPTFLIGHSMGSFISQIYVCHYNNIKGLILSGSTKASFITKVGALLTKIIKTFSKDLTKKSPKLDKLIFGNYNKKIINPQNKFAWLTKDNDIVLKYINDPLCGFICSKGFYYNLTNGCVIMGQKKYIKNIDKNLPIFIHSGLDDPVSNYGKGVKKLYQQYQKLQIKNVSLKLYDGDRHEIYNETNKNEVYDNTLKFILNNL